MARFIDSSFASVLSRRTWLKLSAAGVLGCSTSGWLGALAADTAKNPQRKRSCILLWMSGGPSQLDTFDLKPGHPNGGPFKPIATNVSGIQISEHFPKIAKLADQLAIVRSMTSKEGDHGRATYFLRTGYLPQGPVQYPSLGALVSKELGDDHAELPNYVSIAPFRFLNADAYAAGFLGPSRAPLIVGENIQGPFPQVRTMPIKRSRCRIWPRRHRSVSCGRTPGLRCSARCSASSSPSIPTYRFGAIRAPMSGRCG